MIFNCILVYNGGGGQGGRQQLEGGQEGGVYEQKTEGRVENAENGRGKLTKETILGHLSIEQKNV